MYEILLDFLYGIAVSRGFGFGLYRIQNAAPGLALSHTGYLVTLDQRASDGVIAAIRGRIGTNTQAFCSYFDLFVVNSNHLFDHIIVAGNRLGNVGILVFILNAVPVLALSSHSNNITLADATDLIVIRNFRPGTNECGTVPDINLFADLRKSGVFFGHTIYGSRCRCFRCTGHGIAVSIRTQINLTGTNRNAGSAGTRFIFAGTVTASSGGHQKHCGQRQNQKLLFHVFILHHFPPIPLCLIGQPRFAVIRLQL